MPGIRGESVDSLISTAEYAVERLIFGTISQLTGKPPADVYDDLTFLKKMPDSRKNKLPKLDEISTRLDSLQKKLDEPNITFAMLLNQISTQLLAYRDAYLDSRTSKEDKVILKKCTDETLNLVEAIEEGDTAKISQHVDTLSNTIKDVELTETDYFVEALMLNAIRLAVVIGAVMIVGSFVALQFGSLASFIGGVGILLGLTLLMGTMVAAVVCDTALDIEREPQVQRETTESVRLLTRNNLYANPSSDDDTIEMEVIRVDGLDSESSDSEEDVTGHLGAVF